MSTRRQRPKHPLDHLNDDIRDHIERETADNIARGMTPEDARAAALRSFGNQTRIREDARGVWRAMWIEQLGQDVRYAARALRANPGFAATVVLTLALGIGLNTAVFSVVNAVLLRPISYPAAARLLWVTTVDPRENSEYTTIPDFLDWRDQAQSFEQMTAYAAGDSSLSTSENAVRARVARVTDGFWPITGVRPEHGRLPSPEERDAVVLSHEFFLRWFGGDVANVGRRVLMETEQVTIAGVLPEDFRFQFPAETLLGEARDIEVYVPLVLGPQSRIRADGVGSTPNVIARLKPGASLERGRTELAAIRSRMTQGSNRPWDLQELRVQYLMDRVVNRQTRQALWTLLAAVTFVLLVACANIANLLLARGATRRREIAIRSALGAGRARVLRQFLAESTLVALLGGAAGLILARVGIAAILRLAPTALPRLAETSIDGWVLAFALITSLVTVVLFGVVPAAALWKIDPNGALKEGSKSAPAGSAGFRVRRLLAAAELAFAVVLLTGAGLMMRSFWRMNAHPAEFHPERILTLTAGLTGGAYFEEPSRQEAYVTQLLNGIRSAPGVEAASVMNRESLGARWEGENPGFDEHRPQTLSARVSSDYLQVMGLRLVQGRWFEETERGAIVINESLARRDLAGQDPIGKRLRWKGVVGTVVGVVADLKSSRLDSAAEPEFYVHYSASRRLYSTTVAVRTTGDAAAATASILKVASQVDRTEPLYSVMTLEQKLADTIVARRFNLFLLGAFAAASLLLALIGVYGVIAFLVAQRTQEIGVRVALGARRAEVVRLVTRQGAGIAFAGIGVGVPAAWGLTRLIESFLYEVKPNDPATFASVATLLIATAVLASFVPALRAARVDPLTALRHE